MERSPIQRNNIPDNKFPRRKFRLGNFVVRIACAFFPINWNLPYRREAPLALPLGELSRRHAVTERAVPIRCLALPNSKATPHNCVCESPPSFCRIARCCPNFSAYSDRSYQSEFQSVSALSQLSPESQSKSLSESESEYEFSRVCSVWEIS